MKKFSSRIALLLALVFIVTISGVSAMWIYYGEGSYAEEPYDFTFRYPDIWPQSGINTIVEGNSADNIKTLNDGSVTYDGSDTKYRWTSWSPDDKDRGSVVVMTLLFAEALTFDKLRIYHFIDAGGCDFPDSMSFEYYNLTSKNYTNLNEGQEYSTTENWTNAKRDSRTGVYSMTINDQTVTFTYNYKGAAPCTTVTFDKPITTNSISVTFDAQDGYFVGLMEIEVLYNNANLIR